MSIKNKISIVLIIFLVILFGIAINGVAFAVNEVIEGYTLQGLVRSLSTNPQYIFGLTEYETIIGNWVGKEIKYNWSGVIDYKSCACVYHLQSDVDDQNVSNYYITNIFEIDGCNFYNYTSSGQTSLGGNAYDYALAKVIYKTYNRQYTEYNDHDGESSIRFAIRTFLGNGNNKSYVDSSFKGNFSGTSTGWQNSTLPNEINSYYTEGGYGYVAANYKDLTNQGSSDVTISKLKSGEYTIGPIKIDYGGLGINSVEVYNSDGKKNNYISGWSTDQNGVSPNTDMTALPKNTNFYVIVQGNPGGKASVKINQKTMAKYRAILMFTRASKSSGQNLVVYSAYKSGTFGTTITIGAEVKTVDLTIKKKNAINNNMKAKFHLLAYNSETSKYDVYKVTTSGISKSVSYSGYSGNLSDFALVKASAPSFELNEDNKYTYTIKGLEVGKDYYLVEAETSLSKKKIKYAYITGGRATCSYMGLLKGGGWNVIGFELYTGGEMQMEIIDNYSYLDIEIEKIDRTTHRPLKNIKFVLKYGGRKEGIEDAADVKKLNEEGKWVQLSQEEETGTTKMELVDDINKATTLTTDSNGKINIDKLDISDLWGAFIFYERNVDESQAESATSSLGECYYDAKLELLNCGTISTETVSGIGKYEDDTKCKVTVTIENETTIDPFELDIYKTEIDEQNDLEGVEFKIKVLDKDDTEIGWLSKTIDRAIIYYASRNDEGTTFTTASNGIKIKNLSKDYKYVVYEVKKASGKAVTSDDVERTSGSVSNVSNSDYFSEDIKYDTSLGYLKIGCVNTTSEADVQNIGLTIENDGGIPFELELNKKDTKGNAVKEAEFKIYVEYDGSDKGWLTKGNDDKWTYSKNINQGTAFTTKSNGKIETIQGLNTKYTYLIYETKKAYGYSVSSDDVSESSVSVNGGTISEGITYNSTLKALYIGALDSSNSQATVNVTNPSTKFNLKINKINTYTGDSSDMDGVQFKIQVLNKSNSPVGWLNSTSGKYTYTNAIGSATPFTVSGGKINVNNLSTGYNYVIYETNNSSGNSVTNSDLTNVSLPSGTVNYFTSDIKYVSSYGIKIGTVSVPESTNNVNVSLTVKNKPKYDCSIVIHKVDADTGEPLSGVGFKLRNYHLSSWWWCNGDINSDASKNLVKSQNDARTYYTNEQGYLVFKYLNSGDVYEIFETKPKSDNYDYTWMNNQTGYVEVKQGSNYYSSSRYKYTSGGGACTYYSGSRFENGLIVSFTGLFVGTVKPNGNLTTTEIEVKNPGSISVTINKINSLNEKLSGASFKIQVFNGSSSIGWLSGSSGSWNYTSAYNSSKTWTTNTSGTLSVDKLDRKYTYKIYEITPATGYDVLEDQIGNGMKVDGATLSASAYTTINGSQKAILCKTISASGGTNQTVNVMNTKTLYITGYAWEDWVDTKKDEGNNLYKESSEADKLLNGIKVLLVNGSGTTVKNTTTNTKGEYKINTGISLVGTTAENAIKNYYIKFEYDSKYTEANSTISYYGSVSPKFDKENGSKAIPLENKETEGNVYIYNLSSYVGNFYNSTSHTLEYMNMGLVYRQDSYDYNINQTMAYVKVVINGYTYTYEYGGTGETTATAAPKVKYDNGWAYTRAIYPSDIAYSIANNWNDSSLKVYVVYRIDIKDLDPNGNSNKKKSETSNQVSYVEVDLKVENLTNTYDTNRYELETNYDKSSNGDFDDWSNDSSKGIATYTGNKLNNTIKPNETRTVYIQLKVKDSALNDLLSRGTSYENKATVATAKAYHNYWKAYYGWNSSKVSKLFTPDRKTASVTKSADSIYLKLELGTERTITGKVFEDKIVSTNGEVLGNGKFDTGENTVESVKVELLNESGSLAKVYPKDKGYAEMDATTSSKLNGTYELIGITPGKYYVRFTYGDGSQKIFKADGTEVGTVSIADYKSTIITEDKIKNALINGDKDWYKKVSDTLHSTAVDDLGQRAEYNANTSSRNTIEANIALMGVGVENTAGNSVTITSSNNGTKEKISGINFGIIKQPVTIIETEKVVSNIKITNTQGNIIAEGNPADQNMKYVSDLDGGTHLVKGSTYVKAEINEQELYGSKLEIKYSITIQNNSDVNYYEAKADGSKSDYYGYYYWFGISNTPDSKELTITVDEEYDYIDPSIKKEDIGIDADHTIKIKDSSTYNSELVGIVKEKTGLDYKYIVSITGWDKNLYTTKHLNISGSREHNDNQTQETAKLTVSRYLSADDDDLMVKNVAQAISFKPTPSLIPPVEPQDPTPEVIVTVIPPTGEDTITTTIYIATAIIAGIVIVAGIVIIKKKVIDK